MSYNYRILNAKKSNKKRFPNSSIYIIKIKDMDYYKIGVSQNHKRRFRDIESAMPFNIEIIIIKLVKNAYDLETIIHEVFKAKYIKSEWFGLNKSDIIKAKDLINKCIDVEINNNPILNFK